MLDEIQTGNGRTGRWFGFQHEALLPDVVTVAKGLANGVPIGACLARGSAGALFQAGSHGSTFGGNPLACSAALAVVETIERERLHARAAERGELLVSGLREALAGIDGVREIRGRGLMVGIEMDRPCREVVPLALERGLLVNVTAERVVRLLPPLVIRDSEIARLISILADTVRAFRARD